MESTSLPDLGVKCGRPQALSRSLLVSSRFWRLEVFQVHDSIAPTAAPLASVPLFLKRHLPWIESDPEPGVISTQDPSLTTSTKSQLRLQCEMLSIWVWEIPLLVVGPAPQSFSVKTPYSL